MEFGQTSHEYMFLKKFYSQILCVFCQKLIIFYPSVTLIHFYAYLYANAQFVPKGGKILHRQSYCVRNKFHVCWCHVTCDMWQMGGGAPSLKRISSLDILLWEWRCFEDICTEDESLTDLVNRWQRCFVEQPWLHRVC